MRALSSVPALLWERGREEGVLRHLVSNTPHHRLLPLLQGLGHGSAGKSFSSSLTNPAGTCPGLSHPPPIRSCWQLFAGRRFLLPSVEAFQLLGGSSAAQARVSSPALLGIAVRAVGAPRERGIGATWSFSYRWSTEPTVALWLY